MIAAVPYGAGTRARALSRLRARLWLTACQLAVGVVLVAAWQLFASRHWLNSSAISSPRAVADFLGGALTSAPLWDNLGATLEATAIAFVLAAVAGTVVGLSLGLLPRFERVVAPYIDAMNSMPRIALAPVFVIMFGITTTSKIALGFSIVVFITLSAARAGVRSVDLDVAALARVLGATKVERFFKILLPVAVPSIFAGLRLGVVYALLGVVTSELIASRSGLGQLIQTYAGNFDTAGVYGILVVLAVIAVTLNALMGRVERWLLRWQPDPPPR